MTLKEIKNYFLSELELLYPKPEIENFFYMSLAHFLGINRIDLALQPDLQKSDKDSSPLWDTLERLKQEEPIQYILGQTEFAGLNFKVNNKVLIPRVETEELVRWVYENSKNLEDTRVKERIRILDIGTGSGCIPITLATMLPRAAIDALDISSKALELAKENAVSNDVKINFIEANVLELEKLESNYDIIISNPPYVRESEKNQMRGNVLRHEPDLALYVKDSNPLLFYEKILELAWHFLFPGGQLYFEINEFLADQTVELLSIRGYKNIEVKNDIFGKARMIRALKK